MCWGSTEYPTSGRMRAQATGIGILKDGPAPQGWKTSNHPEGRDLNHMGEPHELHSLQALSYVKLN